jgi:hypothetical protein
VSEDEEEIQFKEEIKQEIKEEIKEEKKEKDVSIISISSLSETESGEDYEVEEVLAERRKNNQTEYLVKFEGNFLRTYNYNFFY